MNASSRSQAHRLDDNDLEEPDQGNVLLGAAAGLAGGLVGAWVMSGFQAALARADITSGVSGRPSTEKAAQRLAQLTGRSMPRRKRPAAGEAVHYAVGSLIGGAYGVAAEMAPGVTAGRGTAFGVAAATVVDETLVPALRFGDPFWKAPRQSHPYSYVSHLVYGAATEAARKLFRRFFRKVRAGAVAVQYAEASPPLPLVRPAPDARRTHLLAFALGATAGLRTTAPLAAVSWAAKRGWIDLKGSPLAFLGSTAAVAVITPMALGELVVDKLPATPDRTEAVGAGARLVSGALCGAAVAGGRSYTAALAGAAGSLVATWLGHAVRTRLSRAAGTDWPIAATEDLVAFGGAAMVCLASLAPDVPRVSAIDAPMRSQPGIH